MVACNVPLVNFYAGAIKNAATVVVLRLWFSSARLLNRDFPDFDAVRDERSFDRRRSGWCVRFLEPLHFSEYCFKKFR